ncbi:MAG: acyl-CoA thioesterase [Opitutales bacterium]|jgi:acyl-CoA thioester hydrolase
MLSSSTKIRVRYEETDQMGVVYHAKYFNWFEVARIQLLDEIGIPYKELEKEGYFLPVLSCSAIFKHPAHFDDRLIIKLEISLASLLRLKVAYEVWRKDLMIATGTTEHAFISKDGKVIRPPASFVTLLEGTDS